MSYRELENNLTYEMIEQIDSVQSLLYECGAKNITDRGAYLSFSSPFREDKNPSAVLYKNNLSCVDFGGDIGGSFSYFYYKCTNESLVKRLNLTETEFSNKIFFKDSQKERERYFDLESKKELRIQGGKIQYDFSKNLLAQKYVRQRFLSREFMMEFQIGFCTNIGICRAPSDAFKNPELKFTKFINRVCIPIYEGSELVSIEGRDFTKKSKPKVLYPKGGSVSHLFNYDNLNKKEPLIVVEGIMDMPRIWQHMTKNITTTFGVNMTPKQKKQLKEFEHVIVFSDSDEAGRRMIADFDEFMERPYWIARLEKGDPGNPDNSIETIENCIINAKESTEFLLEESQLIEETKTDSIFFS